jgi:hypothetical protein
MPVGPDGPALVLGTFPAERAWAPADAASLPALPQLQPAYAVEEMDQLLAAVCRPGDVLLTRRALHPALRDYLAEAGVLPARSAALFGWDEAVDPAAAGASVARLALERLGPDPAAALPAAPVALRPYAVDAHTGELCRALGVPPLPECEVARRANSKAFSTRLADELGVGYGGAAVASAAAFRAEAGRLLASGPVVVKQDFGVSGGGSHTISDERRLDRLHRHLAAEEEAGRAVSLVVEPLLPKLRDFSCHLEIGPAGDFRVLGLQGTVNRGFSYAASVAMPAAEREEVLGSGYGRTMEGVAAALHGLGYHGFACVDSMRLEGGGVVPVLEINARMSMGLVNHHLGARLAGWEGGTRLTHLPVACDAPLDVERVLSALDAAGLLVRPGAPRGIVPLGSATLPLAGDGPGPLRGRLYVAAAADADGVLQEVSRVLGGIGVRTPGLE